MILNKFLDKTIETAKQSALQMYGYNLTDLKSILHEDDKGKDEEGRNNSSQQEKNKKKYLPSDPKKRRGVTFERSALPKSENSTNDNDIESKLTAIRKYAAEQTASKMEEISHWEGASADNESQKELPKQETPSRQLYSRKDIRSRAREKGNKVTAMKRKEKTNPSKTISSIHRKQSSFKQTDTNILSNNETINQGTKSPKSDERSLHKRLDRLESLMHLTLSSDDLSYSSHPAFHKLLHKGVPKRLISKWFHTISDQGFHPNKQEELFQSKLTAIIQDAISGVHSGHSKKLMLFTGRSGSGKTHMIMKLSRQTHLLEGQNIAVASVVPNQSTKLNYYTILAPFCRDHDIPYYRLEDAQELDTLSKKWKSFDHILIDTPSMELIDEILFEQFVNIKQKLHSLYEMETHYLVNTAVNGVAFNDPLAVQVKADNLAFTHIDQSNKWGSTIQLLIQSDYGLRFINSSESMDDGIEIFNPELLAKKLLS
jgi:flagellar biosynthesis GTPase FlhF